uniref:Dynein heavy chain C-terminal domain-containing protein n=1 Tax=Oreochromis aureus TaxID=47969 RepID=A0AAZ1X1F8_OREAU
IASPARTHANRSLPALTGRKGTPFSGWGLPVLWEAWSSHRCLPGSPKRTGPPAYASLKPLASWVSDLLQRINFLQRWISNGIPPAFWISGFFFPQAFLTGTLQNYARRSGTSIDTIGFDFEVLVKSVSEITEIPDTGCYIHGPFLEGARWDNKAGQLTESQLKTSSLRDLCMPYLQDTHTSCQIYNQVP